MSHDHDQDDDKFARVPFVSDPAKLARYGILKVPLADLAPNVSRDDWKHWAQQLSQVTPEITAGEGDGEYVFYRNILEEPDFPFSRNFPADAPALELIQNRFGFQSLQEIRLDDAFCIHYNTEQADTSGARHMDPSDITINICLEKSEGTNGSHVLFHGTQDLIGAHERLAAADDDDGDGEAKPDKFLVSQEEGYATIHWGHHLHETTPLESGRRTNIVLTYWFTDPSKSGVLSRTCYT